MPRFAYRICKQCYDVLDGTGARIAGGRWNSPGLCAVYASTCSAGALLEIYRRHDSLALVAPHHVGEIEIPDDVAAERVPADELSGWDLPESQVARSWGDDWLIQRRTAVLLVPSAARAPLQWNVVLNPAHPAFARIRVKHLTGLEMGG